MGKGSDAPSSTTSQQTTRPFPAQEQALTRLFGLAENQFNLGPQQFFPTDVVAGQSPNTIAGQQLALDAAAPSSALGFQGAGAVSAALDPFSSQSQAIISPLISQLQSQILPGIGSRAIQQGAFGGDRQRIQEQEAAEGTMGAAIYAILRNQLAATGAIGGVQNALLAPSRIASSVGAQQEGREQALIDAERQRFQFGQEAPETALDRLTSRLSGVNIGGTSTTINTSDNSQSTGNKVATGLGGLLALRGLGVV